MLLRQLARIYPTWPASLSTFRIGLALPSNYTHISKVSRVGRVKAGKTRSKRVPHLPCLACFCPTSGQPAGFCANMSDMSQEIERKSDKKRIDAALDLIEAEMSENSDMNCLSVGARALVALLERRAALLGLDAPTDSKARDVGAGVPEPIVHAIKAESERVGLRVAK